MTQGWPLETTLFLWQINGVPSFELLNEGRRQIDVSLDICIPHKGATYEPSKVSQFLSFILKLFKKQLLTAQPQDISVLPLCLFRSQTLGRNYLEVKFFLNSVKTTGVDSVS